MEANMSQFTIPEGSRLQKCPTPTQLGLPPAPRGRGKEIQALRQEAGIVSEFCANCFASPDKLMRCATCKKAFYCNIKCQTEDWKTKRNDLALSHKSVCNLLKEGTELGEFYQKIKDILSNDDFKKEIVRYQELTFTIFNNPKKRPIGYAPSPNPDFIINSLSPHPNFIINSLNGLMQGNLPNSPDFVPPSRGAALAIASDLTQLTSKPFGQAKKVLDLFNIAVAIMHGMSPLIFADITFTKMENLQT